MSHPTPPSTPCAAPAPRVHPGPLRIRTGTWAELGPEAGEVRARVFIEEQGIPKELEWDEDDATALHAVVHGADGQALATGRLLRGGPGVAKIGRVAVLAPARRTGVGRAVMQALMDAARARGDREVMLHAQRSAQSFYLGLGFQVRGEPFDEVGIPHVEMVAPL